jgi:hypothetical protein
MLQITDENPVISLQQLSNLRHKPFGDHWWMTVANSSPWEWHFNNVRSWLCLSTQDSLFPIFCEWCSCAPAIGYNTHENKNYY